MKIRSLALMALGSAPAFTASIALAQAGPGYHDHHMWGGEWHGWAFGPLMMVFWLIVVVGAVLLVLRMLRAAGSDGHRQGKPGPDAIDILRERFAKGEIDAAEFEERRKVLEG